MYINTGFIHVYFLFRWVQESVSVLPKPIWTHHIIRDLPRWCSPGGASWDIWLLWGSSSMEFVSVTTFVPNKKGL